MASDLSIATYNIFMRPDCVFFNDGQRFRLPLMIPRIASLGADIVIVNEAFDDAIRATLLLGLAATYPYQTTVVGTDGLLRQDGGVVILSRWPIRREAQITFDVAEGTDRWGDKGCMYAEVETPAGSCHVFGTHLDAGPGGAAVRLMQVRKIRDFIDREALSRDEPVLVGGDFNMGPYRRMEELSSMRASLRATLPPLVGHTHSYDPSSNILADGSSKHLDHVVFLHEHEPPSRHENEVVQLKSDAPWEDRKHKPNRDLSDHYPVVARFAWTG